jgi:predicted N-acyltransferase
VTEKGAHTGGWAVRWLDAMDEIDPRQWDRLALPQETPLLEWRWLHELEASGSIAPARGWRPRHLTLWSGHTLVAAAPLYIKSHSEGEFVFDHWWTRLAQSHDIGYFPKLVGMSPATPAVATRPGTTRASGGATGATAISTTT